jgi:hypothetical protein
MGCPFLWVSLGPEESKQCSDVTGTSLDAAEDPGPAKPTIHTMAKRILSTIYTFIEGREENFLLIPMKREKVGIPQLLRKQHNQ